MTKPSNSSLYYIPNEITFVKSNHYKYPVLCRSALGANMYTYLKFGLPRVFPPSRGPRDGSSGYDSSDDGSPYLHRQGRNYLRSRSDPDFRNQPLHRPYAGVSRERNFCYSRFCFFLFFLYFFLTYFSKEPVTSSADLSLFLGPSPLCPHGLYSLDVVVVSFVSIG